jgi:hypothetical protein
MNNSSRVNISISEENLPQITFQNELLKAVAVDFGIFINFMTFIVCYREIEILSEGNLWARGSSGGVLRFAI